MPEQVSNNSNTIPIQNFTMVYVHDYPETLIPPYAPLYQKVCFHYRIFSSSVTIFVSVYAFLHYFTRAWVDQEN